MRLDLHLVENGFYQTRARARAAIEAGLVSVNGAVAVKPSQKVVDGALVEAAGDVHPYVSRGGLKLEAALKDFDIDAAGKICLDLGASTGGFTDVLLRARAARVYAVDVGTGQLHEKLRADPRVINLEKTHADDLLPVLVPDPIEIIVCDVSFISLKRALPPALALGAQGCRLAALVKPQFEVGREGLGKGGIAREDAAQDAVEATHIWLDGLPDWQVTHLIDSPITGGDGNKEYLIGATKIA